MCTVDYTLIFLILIAIVAIGGRLSYYKMKQRRIKAMAKIIIR